MFSFEICATKRVMAYSGLRMAYKKADLAAAGAPETKEPSESECSDDSGASRAPSEHMDTDDGNESSSGASDSSDEVPAMD